MVSHLQRIELIFVRPFEALSKLSPGIGELLAGPVLFPRFESVTEEVPVSRIVEHLQIQHKLENAVRKSDHRSFTILGDFGRNEYSAVLDGYVPQPYECHFLRPDEAIVQYVASQQEIPVIGLEMAPESQHLVLRNYSAVLLVFLLSLNH